MQNYKSFLLCLLFILTALVLSVPEFSNPNWHHPVLSFNLSLRVILISFLGFAFLIVLPVKNLSFAEMLSFFVHTISSLCAVISRQILFAIVACELMSVSASFIIAAGGKDNGPAIRYACVHFFVGILLIAGLAARSIDLVIIGLLINCACFPFSFWIVDAYPAASLHGSLYLSLFTTKISFLVAIFHTYEFWQNYTKVLVFFGTVTSVYGIIFSSLEQNIRRFLAYNLVGQMGVLIIAGGLISSSKHAISVLVFRVISSVPYQLLLIAVANKIILRTRTVNLNRVGKLMSIEGIYALIAILTMAASPGTIGFIGKSCIAAEIKINAIDLEIYSRLYQILNFLLYLSVGVKFFYYIFLAKSNLKRSVGKNSEAVITILAFICVIAGSPYLPIYGKPEIFNFVYNTQNICSQFILLLCATLLFIPLRRVFLPRISFKMDIDWILRFLVPCILLWFDELLFKTRKIFIDTLENLTNLFVGLYTNDISNKFRCILGCDSVSFVSASSLLLMSVLLVLLCLNR